MIELTREQAEAVMRRYEFLKSDWMSSLFIESPTMLVGIYKTWASWAAADVTGKGVGASFAHNVQLLDECIEAVLKGDEP